MQTPSSPSTVASTGKELKSDKGVSPTVAVKQVSQAPVQEVKGSAIKAVVDAVAKEVVRAAIFKAAASSTTAEKATLGKGDKKAAVVAVAKEVVRSVILKAI